MVCARATNVVRNGIASTSADRLSDAGGGCVSRGQRASVSVARVTAGDRGRRSPLPLAFIYRASLLRVACRHRPSDCPFTHNVLEPLWPAGLEADPALWELRQSCWRLVQIPARLPLQAFPMAQRLVRQP